MSEPQPLVGGRYELNELIGRGGMGDVYRGRDVETGEPVAVKRLHADIVEENPDIVDRFQREGEALRQLNHPNIVAMLATLEENGQHYLVMEYVSGGSLRELLDSQGRLPLEAVLNLALDLADALTRAHRLNIVHRDIKPDNVLLAEDGTPRLTDFGVACLRDRTRLTQTGSVIGTYAYLSPEACNGLELDERTDIWSFGVMLFEMLAGRLPFYGSGTAQVLTAILTKPAPDIQRLRPGLPPALIDLVYRMLEKDRDHRLSSIRLVGAELEAIIRGLDTPLRHLVFGDYDPNSSRFATPSDHGEPHVPAMERAAPEQTHGLSLYPPQGASTTGYAPQYTPGGSLRATGEFTPANPKWAWIALMVIVTVLACAAVMVIALLLRADRVTRREDATLSPAPSALAGVVPAVDATAAATSTPAPTPLPSVEPVAPGEQMVLVADFEDLGGIGQIANRKRTVARFVADDLEQSLVQAIPFSNVRVRRYPHVLTSAEDARAAAEASGAAVVVWGNFTTDLVEAEVQVGALGIFPHLAFDRATLERTANIRLNLANERAESVAPYVMAVLSVLESADGDAFGMMRVAAIMDMLDVTPAQIVGGGVAGDIHRHFLAKTTSEAFALLDDALAIDPGNALLYNFRAAARQRQGRQADARADAETAKRIGPPAWAMPNYLLSDSGSAGDATAYFTAAVTQRPDDWFPLFLRATNYYHNRKTLPDGAALARADLDASIALHPEANFPYVYSALLALHEGRMQDAGDALRVVVHEFPDPTYMGRLIRTLYGDQMISPFSPTLAAFTNLALGRYGETLQDTLSGLSAFPGLDDLRLLQGAAYCALGEYQFAERSFSRAIGLDARFTLAYLLRADTRLRQDLPAAARGDFAAISRSPQAEAFAPYVAAVQSGALSCATFFNPQNPLLMPAASPTPAPPTPTIEGVPAQAVAAVEPAGPDEHMVLVADLEPIRITPRDVSRFVVSDLTRVFGEELPLAGVAVRRYPRVITSEDEARRVAEATRAAMVIWGSYTIDHVELAIQVGVLDDFPHVPFDRALIERTANVRVRLADERRESAAAQVLAIWNILACADGDQYQVLMTRMFLEGLNVDQGEILGSGAGAQVHRAYAIYFEDTPRAVEQLRAALAVDGTNPLIYGLLSLADLRLGDANQFRRDWESARRLAPDSWTLPLYLTPADDPQQVLAAYGRLIELRPDDWYAYFTRGITLYYGMQDLAKARADLEQSMALEPYGNVSYLVAMLLALREGRLTDAQVLMNVVLTQYPDPDLTGRAFHAIYGDDPRASYSAALFAAGTNLALGQYNRAVTNVQSAADYMFSQPAVPGMLGEADYELSDLFLLQGLALCNLKAYDSAISAYTQAIKFGGDDYAFARALRGQAYLAQVNVTKAEADFAAARAAELGPTFNTWVDGAERGVWNCENFFNYDLDWQRPPSGL